MTDTTHRNGPGQFGYVRTEEAPLLRPPASESGIVGWLRQNMFASVSDFSSIGAAFSSIVMLLMTIFVFWLGISILWSLIDFAFLSAVWTDPDAQKRLVCATVKQGGTLPEDWSGACYPFVDAKWKLFMYYSYPTEELWRPNLVMLVGSVGVAWLVSDAIPRRWLVGLVLIAAGVGLAWWSNQPIANDGVALFNDTDILNLDSAKTGWIHDTEFYKRFMSYPIGAWILASIGLLYLLLVKPVGRGFMGLIMLAVFPVFAFLMLTGGDLEGGTRFWVIVGGIAAFGLLIWLLARLFGEGGIAATLIALLVLAIGAYLLYGALEPLSGFSPNEFAKTGNGMTIGLPVPTHWLSQAQAALGAIALIAVLGGIGGSGMPVRILLGLPAVLMIGAAYGSDPTMTLSLPVGLVIWLLLAVALLGFLAMTIAGLRRAEWHAAMYNFGRGSGMTMFLGALAVGLVAFVCGHWFVDLIEMTAKGEAANFLSEAHIAQNGGLPLLGIEAAETTPAHSRSLWPMPVVETSLWGGLLLTLVVAITGIVASLPIGVLLALGRRSQLPAVRILSIAFIEFWRGVPLITVLFMSSVVLPLFLPEGTELNKLLRALIAVALFSSAYMAEVIRGGLQAIPKGQYEGADSLGLGYGQKMRLIVLPQALTLVIPGIVNTFIGLFKDTTLVLIIGLFDLLGAIQSTFTDSSWSVPVTNPTGYLMAAAIFGIFCFGMSRYSMFMENRLRRGHSR